jgi:hypothetical protein
VLLFTLITDGDVCPPRQIIISMKNKGFGYVFWQAEKKLSKERQNISVDGTQKD